MSSLFPFALQTLPRWLSEKPHAILVATVETDTLPAAVWDNINTYVSPAESEKALRFVGDMDRRTYLAAHILKRSMLSWADPHVHPLAWRFNQGPHGKPSIEGRTDLHFNISHCRGLAACALRFGRPVGIDVEWLGRPAPIEVAQRFFSDDETNYLLRLPDAERHEAFFQIWTLKEAYIKAVGLGLSQPLRDFTVSPDRLVMRFVKSDRGNAPAWRFHQSAQGRSYILAVAWHEEALSQTAAVIALGRDLCLRGIHSRSVSRRVHNF